MRRPMRYAMRTLGVLVFLVLLAHAVLYYLTYKTLRDAREAIADQVELDYASFYVWLPGSVQLNDVLLQPLGKQGAVRVSKIRLRSDDLTFFIKLAQLRRGEFPIFTSAALDLLGAEVELTADLLDGNTGVDLTDRDAQMLACNSGTGLDGHLLRALGYERLAFDLLLDYYRSDKAGELDINMQLDALDIQTMQTRLLLQGLRQDEVGAAQLAGVMLKYLSMQLALTPEYAERMAQHCMQLRGDTTRDEYARHLSKNVQDHLAQLDVYLDPALSEQLTGFYRQMGEISIAINPPTALPLIALANVQPSNLFSSLNLQIKLNGNLLDLSGVKLQARSESSTQSQAASQQGDAQKQSTQKKRYHTVSPSSIARYLQHEVRLTLYDGAVREGVLSSVEEGALHVQQRMLGGSFGAVVPLADIKKAEVFR